MVRESLRPIMKHFSDEFHPLALVIAIAPVQMGLVKSVALGSLTCEVWSHFLSSNQTIIEEVKFV